MWRGNEARSRGVPLVVVGLLIALPLLAGPVRANAGSLSGTRAKLKQLIGRIDSAQQSLAGLQQELNAIAAKLDEVQSHLATTQIQIANDQAAIARAQAQITATQGRLDSRARVAYEMGPANDISFVLDATSFSDLSDRLEALNAAAQSDSDLVAQLRNQQVLLTRKESHLKALETSLQKNRADLVSQQSAIQSKFADEQGLIASLQSDRKQAEQLLHQLESANQPAPGLPPPGGGGVPGVFLVCPVDQPHAYSDDFGDLRPGHIHQGIDIMAPEGTPIRAPFPGNAAASSDPAGGLTVFVYGSGGYVFNAHLSRYGATGSVRTGAIIGYVGSTGDASGPHDHFEWHPGGGAAVDPFAYLNAVC